MLYKTCPLCGANLDPNERCTCREEKKEGRPVVPGTAHGKSPTVSLSSAAGAVKRNAGFFHDKRT